MPVRLEFLCCSAPIREQNWTKRRYRSVLFLIEFLKRNTFYGRMFDPGGIHRLHQLIQHEQIQISRFIHSAFLLFIDRHQPPDLFIRQPQSLHPAVIPHPRNARHWIAMHHWTAHFLPSPVAVLPAPQSNRSVQRARDQQMPEPRKPRARRGEMPGNERKEREGTHVIEGFDGIRLGFK